MTQNKDVPPGRGRALKSVKSTDWLLKELQVHRKRKRRTQCLLPPKFLAQQNAGLVGRLINPLARRHACLATNRTYADALPSTSRISRRSVP